MTKGLSGLLLGLILLTLFSPHHGSTQPSEEIKALQKEIEALKEGQGAIQQELQEIKTLLRSRPALPSPIAQNMMLSIEDTPIQGDHNAQLTLIEFSDYQCPVCARHASGTLPQLEREYIKPGKVKYVFRDFPLESIHKEAFKAAEAAHCAGEQDQYWAMHDRLFAHQKALDLSDLTLHAQALGIDLSIFQPCLNSSKYATKIRNSVAAGQEVGVTGTPTFFFGVTEPNHPKVRVLRIMKGAQPYARLKKVLDSLLPSQ